MPAVIPRDLAGEELAARAEYLNEAVCLQRHAPLQARKERLTLVKGMHHVLPALQYHPPQEYLLIPGA